MQDYTDKIAIIDKIKAQAMQLGALSDSDQVKQLVDQITGVANKKQSQMQMAMVGPAFDPAAQKMAQQMDQPRQIAEQVAQEYGPAVLPTAESMPVQPATIDPNVMVAKNAQRAHPIYGNGADSPITTPEQQSLKDRMAINADMAREEMRLGQDTKMKVGAVRNFADFPTFGLADEIEAGYKAKMNGEDYDFALDRIRMEKRQFAAENPREAIASQLAGAVFTPMPKFAGTPTMAGAKQGAAFSAAYGFGSGEGTGERLKGAGTGAVSGFVFGGLINKFVDVGVNKFSPKLVAATKRAVANPTVENAYKVKEDAYAAVPKGVKVFDNTTYGSLKTELRQFVDDEFSMLPEKAGTSALDNAFKIIDRYDDMTITRYDSVRKGLSALSKNPEYGAAIKGIIGRMDEKFRNASTASGNTQLQAAWAANNAYSKLKTVNDEFAKVENNLINAGKNVNAFDAYRGVVNNILNDKNKIKWFDPAEVEMMKGFIKASPKDRIFNKMAKLAPSDANFWAAMHLVGAATTMNPFLIVSVVATEGAKVIKDKRTISSAQKLMEQMGGANAVNTLAKGGNKVSGPLAAAAGGVTYDEVMNELFPEENK